MPQCSVTTNGTLYLFFSHTAGMPAFIGTCTWTNAGLPFWWYSFSAPVYIKRASGNVLLLFPESFLYRVIDDLLCQPFCWIDHCFFFFDNAGCVGRKMDYMNVIKQGSCFCVSLDKIPVEWFILIGIPKLHNQSIFFRGIGNKNRLHCNVNKIRLRMSDKFSVNHKFEDGITKRLRNLKSEENTGFGTNSNSTGGRFINRNGKANVIKRGVGILNRYSWYHTMLEMKKKPVHSAAAADLYNGQSPVCRTLLPDWHQSPGRSKHRFALEKFPQRFFF